MGELQTLHWYDVDLDRGIIRVREAKTDAGVRIVHMLPILRRELTVYRDQLQPKRNRRVFATSTGAAVGPSNIRVRILARAVKRASAALEAEGQEPLPDGLTPHSLRMRAASSSRSSTTSGFQMRLTRHHGTEPGTALRA